jgi:hypothetical protein
MKLQGKKEEVGCRSGLHKDDTLWFIASVAGIADAATKHCFETNRMPFLPSVLFFTHFLTGESFEIRRVFSFFLFFFFFGSNLHAWSLSSLPFSPRLGKSSVYGVYMHIHHLANAHSRG